MTLSYARARCDEAVVTTPGSSNTDARVGRGRLNIRNIGGGELDRLTPARHPGLDPVSISPCTQRLMRARNHGPRIKSGVTAEKWRASVPRRPTPSSRLNLLNIGERA